MRIGINLLGVSVRKTGIWRYASGLLAALSKIDAENEYLLFTGEYGLKQLAEGDNLKWTIFGSHRRTDRRFKEQAILPGYVRGLRIDLLHSLNNTAPIVLGAKSVVTVHDITFIRFPRERFRREKSVYYRVFVPPSLRRATKIISVSQNTAEDLASVYKVPRARIRCVYNGVNNNFGGHSERVFPFAYLLFVGSVEPVKNVLRVIEAFHLFQKRFSSQHHLVVAGPEDWASSSADGLVRRLGIENRVVFTGEIPDSELESLYRHADLFVFPSLYEGFGLPVLEAMASGTPVITSNVSSLPEVAGDAAILVNPYKTEEIAGAMLRVLTHDGLRRKLSQRGKERARLFTWERCARETLEVYKEVYRESR